MNENISQTTFSKIDYNLIESDEENLSESNTEVVQVCLNDF